MPFPVLIVLHQGHSTPGRLGHALQQLGYTLDVRRPRFGDPLPATMAEHSAAIIFGGPMSVNDSDDYIRREIEWVGVPIKGNKPFLGICLGAQICAKFLGGTSEIYSLAATASAENFCQFLGRVFTSSRQHKGKFSLLIRNFSRVRASAGGG